MDEVAGRGPSARAFLTGLQDKNNECAQCAESGIAVSAAGFCRTCSDFLCTSCIDQHQILRATKHHELLWDKYTVNPERAASDEAKCPGHPNKPIEAYCKDEDIFGCLECLECKNRCLLSDLSHGDELTKELLGIQKAAERCKTLEKQYRRLIQKCLSMNVVCHNVTLEDFKKFRSNILSIVDEIGENISKQADKLKEENERQLRDLAIQVTTYAEQVKWYLLSIEEKKAAMKNDKMFLVVRKTGKDITDSVHHMETLYQDIHIKAFNFSSDPTIMVNLNKNIKVSVDYTPFLSEMCAKSEEKEGYTYIQKSSSPATTSISTSDVNIKSPEDSSDCKVFGMAELSSTQLILSDWSNNCLKLLDLTSSTIIKRRTLKSQPWNIIILPDRVAVSLPLIKQIQIVRANKSLDPCGAINVSGNCYGLHYTGDQLVVSFDRPEAQVQIIDLTGNVLHSFQHDATGNALFARPLHQTLSADNKLIYVSDCNKHTITCLDTTGVVQWVYQDQELNSPKDVSTGGDGCVYVTSCDTIHVISSDGAKIAVIPQSQSGVKKPRSVCYSSYHRALYVSSASIKTDHRNYISKLKLQ